MQYNFEWDPNKAHVNARKHGVTFEEATKVFDDPMALTVFDDEESSETEDRWVTLGQIVGQHYLVVVHTFRNANEDAVTIRLISARPATKHEIRQYEQG
ncbi:MULTISPECIES: BrnT family toxin [Marinobacter]|uniref:BrnT family toxin n=1 Tax=Marinobacter metalliresistant TaxID=2961995 RepID=A0ABZ2W4P3_9GAMM|nr:BrnT family toxin [Marinobacter sp. Arc7-DN-1]AXS82393.1 BrnT family toxin [Marinobacter sp. Arc7-DN-1]